MIQSFELWKFLDKKCCLQKFIQKNFLLSTFIQKDLQKFIKTLPNWIQVPAPIHFSSLSCHQGISIPGMTLQIKSHPSINLSLSPQFTPSTQVLLLTCKGHTFMWSTVDAPIAVPTINQPYTIPFFLLIP
jgi:hypothetical protein